MRYHLSRRSGAPQAVAGSFQFFASASGDVGRLKVFIGNTDIPANVGTEFTVEMFLKASLANQAASVTEGPDEFWTNGNIFYDRDRFGQVRGHGGSLSNGRVCFGHNSTTARTIMGTSDIRAVVPVWRHVALQRWTNGDLAILVHGVRERFFAGGPTGTLQYQNDDVPQSSCGATGNQSCSFSDPYGVWGSEKHDVVPDGSICYTGGIGPIRISQGIRYLNPTYAVPTVPWELDANTRALYLFRPQDITPGAGADLNIADLNGNQSPMVARVGGPNNGPIWSADHPFVS